jgi:hypothetical protein
MGERARTLALVVCLLLLATLLAGLSAGLGASAVDTTVPKGPSLGTLLVRVGMNQRTNISSTTIPIAHANVSISSLFSGFHIPLVFQTNSSGEFEISFGTGAYALSVSGPQFQKGINVAVQANMTTEVDATVTRHSYPTLFSDLQDTDSSDSVAPWSYVSVAVSSSVGLPLNDSLFIDGSYGTFVTFFSTSTGSGNLTLGTGQTQFALATTSVAQGEARALLISSNADSSSSSHLLWLTLQPESFLSLSGLVSVSLATYATELQVTTYAA